MSNDGQSTQIEYPELVAQLEKRIAELEAFYSVDIVINTPVPGFNNKAIEITDDDGRICVVGHLNGASPNSIVATAALTSPTQITTIPATPPGGATPGTEFNIPGTPPNYFYFRSTQKSYDGVANLLRVPTPTSNPQTYWLYVWVKVATYGWLSPVEVQFPFVLTRGTACGDHDD